MSALLLTLLILPIFAVADTDRARIDDILQGVYDKVAQQNGSWTYRRRFCQIAARELESYDAALVTEALYSWLKLGAPLGDDRAIVALIATETNAFSPDTWLDRMAQEDEVFYRTSAMGIMAKTKFHNHPRFQAVLREALQDQRDGLPSLSRIPTASRLRVCEAAYNHLMEHRDDKPREWPITISTPKGIADALIADLRRELGIPDPPAAQNGDAASAASATPGSVSHVSTPVRQGPPPVAVKPVPKAEGDMIPWLIGGGLLIAGLIGIALYRRTSKS